MSSSVAKGWHWGTCTPFPSSGETKLKILKAREERNGKGEGEKDEEI